MGYAIQPLMLPAYDPCIAFYSTKYLNLPQVQTAMHANVSGIINYPWVLCRCVFFQYTSEFYLTHASFRSTFVFFTLVYELNSLSRAKATLLFIMQRSLVLQLDRHARFHATHLQGAHWSWPQGLGLQVSNQ